MNKDRHNASEEAARNTSTKTKSASENEKSAQRNAAEQKRREA